MNLNSDKKIKILYLYAELSSHIVGIVNKLVASKEGVEIDIVYWDIKNVNSSQYIFDGNSKVNLHKRSLMPVEDIFNLLVEKRPTIVHISGWMDPDYIKALRRYKKKYKSIVVCGLDDQWYSTPRQWIGRIYFKIFYRNLFDFMWICGQPQYSYAQRLGYSHSRIVGNLYSADVDKFKDVIKINKRFVFVGRFDPIKSLDLLVGAYLELPDEIKSVWPLVLIGDGELKEAIVNINSPYIKIIPFLQTSDLVSELQKGGVACLTSKREQWGVAIQEMALLGYPLIVSSSCGAATEFLISEYNGILFRSMSINSLYSALLKITTLSDQELLLYGTRSRGLGLRINPELAACSLLSTIYLDNV